MTNTQNSHTQTGQEKFTVKVNRIEIRPYFGNLLTQHQLKSFLSEPLNAAFA